MRCVISLLAVLATASPAAAQHFDPKDSETYRPIGEGLALAISSPGAIYVVRGKQSLRLAPADTFKSFAIDKRARKVTTVVTDFTCEGTSRHEWTFDHLRARLENASAFALHIKKDFKSAAAGFARAVALDPSWKLAAYNLASAQQLLGDKPAAMTTLAPWIASEPLQTYVHVTADPELAPLLDQPALAAIRSTQPGTVTKISTKGFDGKVLFAPARGLVAIAREEASWGAMTFTVELQIWDPAQAKLVASETIVGWNETLPETRGLDPAKKQIVTERMARLEAQLAALGFRPAKVEIGIHADEGAKVKVSFPKAKLGLVGPGNAGTTSTAFQPGVVNVLRKNTSLGAAKITGRFTDAKFVEDASALVIEMQRHSAEGCDGGPEVALTVLKI